MDVNIQGLQIRFDNRDVFSDFNLSVKSGEFVCILGKSGCGKTVLLNSILGNLKPTQGKIQIGGVEVKKPSKRIAMVYQDFFILPWLTLRENIQLGGAKPEVVEEFARILKIHQYLDYLPKEVSIGTKQRASIARALTIDADVILMDEPLCSVDAINGEEIRSDLKNVCANKTVIYITHDISEALFLSSRIIVLGKDNSIALDTPSSQASREMVLRQLTGK